MVTDAEQEARDERKRARASVQIVPIQTLADGSAPAEGEEEFNQVVWTRHHRPERAAAEGEPVLTEE
jgi:hypothetical protein